MSFSICQRAPCKISIHALREEGDPSKPGVQARREPISIHALREEGDTDTPEQLARYKISIHALREEGNERCFLPRL